VGGALNGRAARQGKNGEHKEAENTHRFGDCETHTHNVEFIGNRAVCGFRWNDLLS